MKEWLKGRLLGWILGKADELLIRVLHNPKSSKLGLLWGGVVEAGVSYLSAHGCHVAGVEWFAGLGPVLWGAYMTDKDKVIATDSTTGKPVAVQVQLPNGQIHPVVLQPPAQPETIVAPQGS
jgi:hypothetical protein